MYDTDITQIKRQKSQRIIHKKKGEQEDARRTALLNQLTSFPDVSLDQMKSVQLMDRIDCKFVVSFDLMQKILKGISSFYYVQKIANKRISFYSTQYYDTPGYFFYHSHVNGKLNRFKVRTRSYIDSKLSFLEVKKKSNKGRTQKFRIPEDQLRPDVFDFINNCIPNINPSQLKPVLSNNFQRITLTNRKLTERVTIDFNISVRSFDGKREKVFSDLYIIEIKQNKFTESHIRNVLKEFRVKSTGISKYCLGLTLTNQDVKSNNYKRKIHFLKKHIQL